MTWSIRTVHRFAPVLLVAGALACDASPLDPGSAPQIRVQDLTLEAVGDSATLEADIVGARETPRWESLNPAVATVTEAGLAVAVAGGTATVRIHVGDHSATGTITVLPPVEIELSDLAVVTDPSGNTGMRMRLRNAGGRGYYRLEYWRVAPDGRHERVLFDNADAEAPVGLDIEFSTYLLDEPADWVLALSREPRGTTYLRTACVRLDGGAVCPSDVPEVPAPVDSLVVTPGAHVMEIGHSVQYAVTAYAAGTEVTGRAVTWRTVTPAVISLSSNGLAVALAAGYGQVEAEVEGITSSVGLTVTAPPSQPVGSVAVVTPNNFPIRLWTGQGSRLEARVYDEFGNRLEGQAVTWAVQNTAVAMVDSTGWLVAVGAGTTTVSATAGGKTGYATVGSFVLPTGGAELVFRSMLSDTSAAMVAAPVDTTWTDSLGVSHAAFLTFHSGRLDMDWSGTPTAYEQRLTVRTYLYGTSLQLVAETEYVDRGSVSVLYDVFTGWHIYQFTSSVTPGLAYEGRYSLPGELAVLQPVGNIPAKRFYFALQQ